MTQFPILWEINLYFGGFVKLEESLVFVFLTVDLWGKLPLARFPFPEPKFLNFKGIDSKESIPTAYEAWRAGTTTLFLLVS